MNDVWLILCEIKLILQKANIEFDTEELMVEKVSYGYRISNGEIEIVFNFFGLPTFYYEEGDLLSKITRLKYQLIDYLTKNNENNEIKE